MAEVTEKTQDESPKKRQSKSVGMWMGFGVGIGAAFGNPAYGAGIGFALGAAAGLMTRKNSGK